MKLANRAYVVTLLLLTLVFTAFAQDRSGRSENDPRNSAPTVGTGGPVGGPTGLFTVYDGWTLRRGEYTFSLAVSNFDRDPGNADFTEVPVSFQIGVTNRLELFFNTDMYRGVKINSPRNLSGFYLPNSQFLINNRLQSAPAIILAPQGPGTSQFPNAAVFRPTGSQPFAQYPFFGLPAGNFGLTTINAGTIFGFGTGIATLGPVRAGNNGADAFPGIGSVYGSILPGVVLQTTPLVGPTGQPAGEGPLVFTLAPSYLPDAPFISRTWGESSFSTFTGGFKWRWTNPLSAVGVGLIGYYRWFADHGDEFGGFNQLQRGASPGGSRGDFGLVLFADARLRKWMNLSANLGYHYNSSVKADEITLLDRPDEVLASFGADFPVNKYFQPIAEFRTLQYVGGRTPNAFENHPMDGIVGARIFPARWFGIGLAYRHHFNQQDRDSFDSEESFRTTVTVACTPGTTCVPVVITNTFTDIPQGFRPSSDPHGYIFQAWIGRRDKRLAEVVNQAANVTALNLSDSEINLPCPPGFRSTSGACNDSTSISVTTTAVDPENDVLTYNYTVSGGRIVGTGASVSWDLSGLQPGSYTITAGVDDGCGVCGTTQTRTITIRECPDCVRECSCPSLTVSGPAGITAPGDTMTFTANVSGGTQDQVVTYNWTVSAGTIESGQGTPSITVRAPSDGTTNVTATVELGGLPPNCDCPRTASETAGVAPKPEASLVNEFGNIPADEVRAQLDAFFADLQANPDAQGYIINYGPPRQVAARERLIRNHIAFRRFDANRITIVNGGDQGDGLKTKLYRVPAGAENPTP